MSLHLQRQFEKLKKMILTLGARVEEDVQAAIRAIETRDADLGQRVLERDHEIDMMEVDVEEECLHTLACYNPVAQDLRFAIAILKINNDLERIGDLAVNIAEQAIALSREPEVDFTPFGVYEMGPLAQTMVKQSLDALVGLNTELAEQVCRSDDKVDEIHRQLYDKVEQRVNEDVEQFPQLLRMLVVARNLERMADHATNIAEDVLYMAKGEIVRHANSEPEAVR